MLISDLPHLNLGRTQVYHPLPLTNKRGARLESWRLCADLRLHVNVADEIETALKNSLQLFN